MTQCTTSSIPKPTLAIYLLKWAKCARYRDLDTSLRFSGGPGFLAGNAIDNSESSEGLIWQF